MIRGAFILATGFVFGYAVALGQVAEAMETDDIEGKVVEHDADEVPKRKTADELAEEDDKMIKESPLYEQ